MGLAAAQAGHAREVSDAVPLALLDRPRHDERPEGQALDRQGLALGDALRQEHGERGEQAAHGATQRSLSVVGAIAPRSKSLRCSCRLEHAAQSRPFATPSSAHPAPRRLAPPSSGRV